MSQELQRGAAPFGYRQGTRGAGHCLGSVNEDESTEMIYYSNGIPAQLYRIASSGGEPVAGRNFVVVDGGVSALFPALDAIAQHADTLDLDLDHVARFHRLRRPWSAGVDDVARLQRDEAADVADDGWHVEDEVLRPL